MSISPSAQEIPNLRRLPTSVLPDIVKEGNSLYINNMSEHRGDIGFLDQGQTARFFAVIAGLRERPLFANTGQVITRYLPARLRTGSALFTGRQGGLKRQRIQQLFRLYTRQAELGPKFTVRCKK